MIKDLPIQIKEVFQPILKQLRLSNYKIPNGYMQWDELSYDIALASASIPAKIPHPDAASFFSTQKVALWMIMDAPIYCISDNLIEALRETNLDDIEKILPNLPVVLPTFLLLPPRGSLVTPDGDSIEFMVIDVSEKTKPEGSQGHSRKYPGIEIKRYDHDADLSITCTAIDKGGFTWFNDILLQSDGSITSSNRKNSGFVPMDEVDYDFNDYLKIFSLQILSILAYEPDLLTGSDEITSRTKGRGFSKSGEGNTARYPRWLGADYRSAIESNSCNGGTHRSPTAHWRKGHIRVVGVGKGRAEQKPVWIRPVLVNPS